MKQLPMTPELAKLITDAVGPDVDTTGLAVFECIALNTKPLPGKMGSIFENATVMPVTLRQMADSIAGGNHLPLISDHQLMGEPKGRAFFAELNYNSEGGDLELRALFYLDPTETVLIQKLNSGSLDEVSVSFLSTQLLCSQCGWDYMGEDATYDNVAARTCANDHTIGTDGVHAQLVGLSKFVELSLVARGAADRPKIIGKSQSVLLPPSSMRLAAKGFEIDGLICQAGQGELKVTIDTNKLFTDLVEAKTEVNSLKDAKTGLETQLSAATASRDEAVAGRTAAEARVAELETELAAAKAAPSNEADYAVALTFLGDVYGKILTAKGEQAPAELPATVSELKAAIEEKTAQLTAILPVGGVTTPAGGEADGGSQVIHAHVFSNRKLGN
jgi:hypothetical protein